VKLTIWDVGGQTKLRPLWRHYFRGSDALIYVVDSSDQERFAEAADELRSIVNDDEMRDAAVLIFANKQDMPSSVRVGTLSEKLGLAVTLGRKAWRVEGCCATTGEGLYEGLDWLSATLKLKKK
jgi:ADP-ribosylation factor 1/2